MLWVEIFAALMVSHLVGDFILQTEFQATNKRGGLSLRSPARRALGLHVLTYTLAFVPVLAWLASEHGPLELLAVAAAIAVPHAAQDDGRLLAAWMRSVKHTPLRPGPLATMVDQSFHVVTLFLLAVVVGSSS